MGFFIVTSVMKAQSLIFKVEKNKSKSSGFFCLYFILSKICNINLVNKKDTQESFAKDSAYH